MYLNLMTSCMAKLPSVPGISFRGAGAMPIGVADSYRAAARATGSEEIVTELAFTSTSTSNEKSFGGNVGYQFTIEGNNGKDVSAY